MTGVTVELHIDSKGFTWQFYNKDHIRIAEWSMKHNPKGGYRSTAEGGVSEALAASNYYDSPIDPLMELFEAMNDLPSPGHVSDVLRAMEKK